VRSPRRLAEPGDMSFWRRTGRSAGSGRPICWTARDGHGTGAVWAEARCRCWWTLAGGVAQVMGVVLTITWRAGRSCGRSGYGSNPTWPSTSAAFRPVAVQGRSTRARGADGRGDALLDWRRAALALRSGFIGAGGRAGSASVAAGGSLPA
jgi:hypothetical protein